MITLVIFTVVISMIYSVFNAFLKQATSERKVAKTEMDVINVAWPLLKEIQSAGLGVPTAGTCTPTISSSGTELTIHSTSSGDSEHAGKWSHISGTTCVVSGLPTAASEDTVVVINSQDKSYMARTSVAAGTPDTLDGCSSSWTNHIAYWSPYTTAGNLECYETKYSLRDYAVSDPRPATCEATTQKLARSAVKTTSSSFQSMLDCVLNNSLTYRFGCISSTGSLTWKTDSVSCGADKLRLVKVGMVIQSSMRRDILSPTPIKLFEDLASSLQVTINLTSDQQAYKWRKLEQTIILKNLE